MFIYLHYTYDPKDEPYNPREKDAERTVCLLSHFPKTAAAATAKSLQSCPTLRPHRWQSTRLPCPWDSPGKNTGVGCHCLLKCMKMKNEREVAQSCPTLGDPMD